MSLSESLSSYREIGNFGYASTPQEQTQARHGGPRIKIGHGISVIWLFLYP